MKFIPVAYLFILVSLAGCRSLDTDRLVLNPRSHLYEARYGGSLVPLRLKSGVLVDGSNLDDFRIELAIEGNHYPFSRRKEPSVLLKRSDWRIAACFDSIHSALARRDFSQVFTYAGEIRTIYPQADWFSNLAFLEGYAFEQVGSNAEAKKSYTRFLDYSSQTYSKLQRGYEAADPNDSLYLEQRNAARQFVNGNRVLHVFDFPPIPPKHPIIPNQPGFLDNTSAFSRKQLSAGLSLGKDYLDDLSLGLRLSHPLSSSTRLVVQADVSENTTTGTLGLPLQLYRAHTNQFGVKLSPFLTYGYMINNQILERIPNQRSSVNGGFQVSAGYFPLPNVSIGGVYLHYLRDLPFQLAEANLLPCKNVLDMSLYWGLLDNLSLKAGVKNKDLLIGCFLSGWEIAWSLNHQRLILSSVLF